MAGGRGGRDVTRQWNAAWEKLLSVLLTLNMAVMGWLWTNIARLAERIDKHVEDRAIHQPLDRGDFVGRREFEVWRESDAAARNAAADELKRLQGRVEKALDERGRQDG